MNYILFDDKNRTDLLPLTFTRPISEIRIGILTITEKWNTLLHTICSYQTEEYLSIKYRKQVTGDNIFINGSILPTAELVAAIGNLSCNELLMKEDIPVAVRTDADTLDIEKLGTFEGVSFEGAFLKISDLWDIFSLNGDALKQDFLSITAGRTSAPIHESNTVRRKENIFIEEGAEVFCAVLNATDGPIYIGKDAVVMENSVVRGPFAMCEHAELKMAAKIYGPTTLGPYCKVGGEVNNSVLMGYSSKAHDGFLGNSVLGEWCNLGADTNNSNLKNNYSEVKLWNYTSRRFKKTGLQFCGLIMGDHSKCAINTMFNTGTVVGVFANIFGAGFPRNFVPSFAWGGSQGMMVYTAQNAFEVAEIVMARRGKVFDDTEKAILQEVYELSAQNRRF